jgi:6-phosphogluconolactonase/glucosamine-6-phosphate isomerase/deaminase
VQKKVYLLVSGEKKASILKQVVEGEISNAVPGSLLRNHPNCILFADKPACSLLSA